MVWIMDEHVRPRDFTAQKYYSDRQKIGAGGDENLVIYFKWPNSEGTVPIILVGGTLFFLLL